MCGRCLREGSDPTFLSDLDAVRARKVRSANKAKRKEKALPVKRTVAYTKPAADPSHVTSAPNASIEKILKESSIRWRNHYQLPKAESSEGVVVCTLCAIQRRRGVDSSPSSLSLAAAAVSDAPVQMPAPEAAQRCDREHISTLIRSPAVVAVGAVTVIVLLATVMHAYRTPTRL